VKKRLLLGHNPVTGGRHLGQYFGSMIDLVELQDEYDCCVILDDWMDIINYPLEKDKVLQRSLFVLNEFIKAGVDTNKVTFGLSTFFLKELSEIFTLILGFVDSNFLDSKYPKTFFGHLKESDRVFLGLQPSPTLLEKSYNLYGPVSYTIGLNIDIFMGGHDVEGYIDHIKHVLNNINDKTHFSVNKTEFMPSKFPYILDSFGEFMTQGNGLFISDSEQNLRNYLKETTSEKFWKQIGYILNSFDNEVKLSYDKEVIENRLIEHLSIFRKESKTNKELLDILYTGSQNIANQIFRTTEILKERIGLLELNKFD
jgi:hypothetical protein